MSSPLVHIIILNWNNPADTIECLQSVYQLDYDNYRVIVVDNGSTDDSVARLRSVYPELEIIETGENLGYAGGNNVGIRAALDRGAEYCWILNDDATVAPDSLGHLVAAAYEHPEAGFLGPIICTHEQPDIILSAGGCLDRCKSASQRGVGRRDDYQYDQPSVVDFLSGAVLLVSREVIEAVGFLDDLFFAYHEDVEWCYRGAKRGFNSVLVPQAKAWHPDTRLRDADSPTVTYYMARNNLLFAKKHHLGFACLMRHWLGYIRTLSSWSVRPKWKHKRSQRDALARALGDYRGQRFGRAELSSLVRW